MVAGSRANLALWLWIPGSRCARPGMTETHASAITLALARIEASLTRMPRPGPSGTTT
ncbi:hypothetical protein TM233_67440 [Bradyrhizobium sp. TM233]|nr:hypothetical protein TM233_67440 [Bradyrhizobium sp. TM233]